MSETTIEAYIASKPALATLIETSTVQAYNIGYGDGYQDGYEMGVADGRKQRERALVPVVADGLRKGLARCGEVLQTRRKRKKE